MKLIVLALTCVAIFLVASACTETATPTNTNTSRAAASPAAPAATATADPLATAKANYTKNCEPCHGPTGEGGQSKSTTRQIKVPSLKATTQSSTLTIRYRNDDHQRRGRDAGVQRQDVASRDR
jgi:cytochrome c553